MRSSQQDHVSISVLQACSRSTWRVSKPDSCSSKWISSARGKRLIAAQHYSPYEMGLGRLVQLDKGPFVGQSALRDEHVRGAARQIVGLTINWEEVERLYQKLELAPQVPATASRVAVPIYRDGRQVGKSTSTTWSPVLKKMIALGTVDRGSTQAGSRLEMEVTVEAVRHRVGATVTPTPFFNPPRKTSSIS